MKVWIYESGETFIKFGSEEEARAAGVEAVACELGPVIPAGSANEHGVPVAEE